MTRDDQQAGLQQKRAESVILRLCRERGVGKTICPSEAARVMAGDKGHWRSLMEVVRVAGSKLSSTGHINITQKGRVVDLATTKGPVRFGLPMR